MVYEFSVCSKFDSINDATQKIIVDFNHIGMDKIVESMTSRFVKNSLLCMDFKLLSFVNFDRTKIGLPEKALKTISKICIRFTD